MKVEHVIIIVLAALGGALHLLNDEIDEGPERMAMLEYRVSQLEEMQYQEIKYGEE